MQEILGADLFDYWKRGGYIVITTNGSVKTNGCAVMGRGVAEQAVNHAKRFPYLLGQHLRKEGNIPFYFTNFRMFTLPVKHQWDEVADIRLIIKSAERLKWLVDHLDIDKPIHMPRPGCGNGKLEWRMVQPVLEDILDDRFVIVEKYHDAMR